MFKVWFFLICVGMPTALAAHSWLDGEPELTKEQVESVVERIEAFDTSEVLSRPTEESAAEFLDEVLVLMEDFSGETGRVLLLFEAIRQGAVNSSGQATGTFGWAFEDRVALKDFPAVSAYAERLDRWLAPLIQE